MFFLPKKVMSPFKNTIRATSYVKDRLQEGLHTFIHHESFGGVLLFFLCGFSSAYCKFSI